MKITIYRSSMEREEKYKTCNRILNDFVNTYLNQSERLVLLEQLDKAQQVDQRQMELYFVDIFLNDIYQDLRTLEVENEMLRMKIKDLKLKNKK